MSTLTLEPNATTEAAAPEITVLAGHDSEATAYLINDYPYGFSLRCQKKVWIEYKPKFGYRLVEMTSNPKRPGTWNKPKAGNYYSLTVMFLDAQNYVQIAVADQYHADKIDAFAEKFAAALTSPTHINTVNALRQIRDVAADRARRREAITAAE